MMKTRRLAAAFVVAAAALTASAVRAADTRPTPAYWPESEFPAGQRLANGRTGCRMEMKELLAKYAKDELILKCATEDSQGHLGTYLVGEEMPYNIAIGPKANRYFGSVKHGRDGGYLAITVSWTDAAGTRVVGQDEQKNTAGC